MLRKVRGSRIFRAGAVLALLLLVALLGAQIGHAPAAPAMGGGARPAGVAGAPGAPGAAEVAEAPVTFGDNGFVFGRSVKNDVSPPLSSIKPAPVQPATTIREMPEPAGEDLSKAAPQAPVTDPVVQRTFGTDLAIPAMPAPIRNFDGVGNIDGVYPPDTNGDVGPNHYVQWVNLHYQIWNKSGVSVYGPAAGNTLWSGFGGACQSQNAGDPIVLYDSIADRWVLSQFTSSSPYGECVAVSTTGDPTGSYYRYFFQFSTSIFYDYPHMGVWPDGYYMSANRFGTVSYQGASAIVFDRAKMLAGQPATYQEKQISSSYGTLLPSDLDGPILPAAGEPNFFADRRSSSLDLWKFHVDWTTPANSTFTGPTSLGVAAYNQLCASTRNCIKQPGTSVGLDGLGDRLMHRLAYRNFGDHESLVATHNVNAVSSGTQAGVRWYEVRSPNSSPVLYQQGTYAPDSNSRWLGSIAMDQSGNIALGYSVASTSVYPSIRYTGRLAGDPLGQMTQGESTLIAGSGSQTGTAYRWGDYAMMTVDPTDDCTFWFTTEYIQTTGGAPWKTRIGSFKFPGCGGVVPTPTNTPTPGPTATNTPVPTNTPTATPNPNPADFTLSAATTSQTVSRGGSGTYTVNITAVNGFNSSVSLSVSGLPSRTSGSFSPNPVSGGTGTSTLTVNANRNAPRGTYTLTITGTGGGKTHSQTVTLIIQ